jgi:hypothetical protein
MSMRKIRDVLRLTHELGLSVREVRAATAGRKPAAPLHIQQCTALAGCSVRRRIISQVKGIVPHSGK